MYCQNCGKKLNDEDKFCSNCGQATSVEEFQNKEVKPEEPEHEEKVTEEVKPEHEEKVTEEVKPEHEEKVTEEVKPEYEEKVTEEVKSEEPDVRAWAAENGVMVEFSNMEKNTPEDRKRNKFVNPFVIALAIVGGIIIIGLMVAVNVAGKDVVNEIKPGVNDSYPEWYGKVFGNSDDSDDAQDSTDEDEGESYQDFFNGEEYNFGSNHDNHHDLRDYF